MYEILIASSALRDYKSLPDSDSIIERINKAIDALEKNPRPKGCKKLKGRNAYRIRVGNYRIIYEINDNILVIVVIRIRNRKEVYRNI